MLTFKLNHLFDGFKPLGYHLVNVLLHCLATGLVVKVARHVLQSSCWGTIVTGALFASHPIHTEAVAGVVGRADLAACNFYLLAFLTYCKHVAWREQNDKRCWSALIGAIVLSIAAVLCKETAATALLLCGLYDIIRATNGYRDKVSASIISSFDNNYFHYYSDDATISFESKICSMYVKFHFKICFVPNFSIECAH